MSAGPATNASLTPTWRVYFQIGTSTVYRYVREALTLLAAMVPTLDQAIANASRKAYIVLDRVVPRIDMSRVCAIVDSTPAMSEVRKEYLRKALCMRHGQMLVPSYERAAKGM